eukprot:TRINITY_DN48285_c0_g1_i1.p1 TRINITY_DN48285_c0_g1~~TRINITY_DN48285_c0_g1_i1.p1  ORF type:complete len:345 (+),score=13.51 TRINITY_DN48285_c0_g1_i1:72-1037(+)
MADDSPPRRRSTSPAAPPRLKRPRGGPSSEDDSDSAEGTRLHWGQAPDWVRRELRPGDPPLGNPFRTPPRSRSASPDTTAIPPKPPSRKVAALDSGILSDDDAVPPVVTAWDSGQPNPLFAKWKALRRIPMDFRVPNFSEIRAPQCGLCHGYCQGHDKCAVQWYCEYCGQAVLEGEQRPGHHQRQGSPDDITNCPVWMADTGKAKGDVGSLEYQRCRSRAAATGRCHCDHPCCEWAWGAPGVYRYGLREPKLIRPYGYDVPDEDSQDNEFYQSWLAARNINGIPQLDTEVFGPEDILSNPDGSFSYQAEATGLPAVGPFSC